MCNVEKITSCEISFLPVKSADYAADVTKVLEIIGASGLEHTVGLLSTTILGAKGSIIRLIDEIYDAMNESCGFTMVIKLSNICGCENT